MAEVIAPQSEPVKAELPAGVESVADRDENGESREANGMPRRSRRSPRHLRVSGQRRRRYRDERYPTQSPMPLTVACASPEMASGKVWIRYPVVSSAGSAAGRGSGSGRQRRENCRGRSGPGCRR